VFCRRHYLHFLFSVSSLFCIFPGVLHFRNIRFRGITGTNNVFNVHESTGEGPITFDGGLTEVTSEGIIPISAPGGILRSSLESIWRRRLVTLRCQYIYEGGDNV